VLVLVQNAVNEMAGALIVFDEAHCWVSVLGEG
jgi:hypothetical protein